MKRFALNDAWILQSPSGFLEGFAAAEQGETVTLPHDGMIHTQRRQTSQNGAAGGWYQGDTWIYLRELAVPQAWLTKRVMLELEGVACNGMVYVNGQFAGKCPSAYTTFRVNIGALLHEGRNELKVVAKNGMNRNSRWYVGGGLLRPVYLLLGEQAGVEDIRFTTVSLQQGTATVRADVELYQQTLGKTALVLELQLADDAGTVVAKDRQPVTLLDICQAKASVRMDVQQASLWSLDDPRLYSLQCRLLQGERVIEQQQVRVGIRSLQLSRTRGLTLNGEGVKLRGGCIHHDNGVLGGVSMKDAELWRVGRMKAAGFNALRSAHNPASQALLEACDELGMLVVDELFDTWNVSKADHDESLTFQEWWQFEMESMVRMDYNHPCVVMYTLGNEIPETGTPAGASLNRRMAERLRRLDATRPAVNCINGMFSVMPRMREILSEVVGDAQQVPSDINAMMTLLDARIDDIMRHRAVTEAVEETFAGVDVCGYNYMDSRYEGDGELYPNRIILGSETTPSSIGKTWPRIRRLPFVLGDFCWTAWEYIGEAGVGKNDYDLTYQMYGPWPWFLANCGDFDLCGQRRPQSYYREIVYGLRQTPYLAVERPQHYNQPKYVTNWTWSDVLSSWTWHGMEGSPVHVEVYSGAEEVALLCNGQELSKQSVGKEKPYMAVFDTLYQPGELTAVAYSHGVEQARTTLTTAGQAAGIRLSCQRLEAPATEDSLFYVDIAAVDSAGARVSCAAVRVRVNVEGAGRLAALGSANPRSLEGFDGQETDLFDGCGMLIVRAGAQAGKITITARGDGLAEGTLALQTVESKGGSLDANIAERAV